MVGSLDVGVELRLFLEHFAVAYRSNSDLRGGSPSTVELHSSALGLDE